MPDEKGILAALRNFADAVTAKMTTLTPGEPEDQLRAPFEVFMEEAGGALAQVVASPGETKPAARIARSTFYPQARLRGRPVSSLAPIRGLVENRKPSDSGTRHMAVGWGI